MLSKDYKRKKMKKILLTAALFVCITAVQAQVQGKLDKAKANTEEGLQKAGETKDKAETGLKKADEQMKEAKNEIKEMSDKVDAQKEKLDPTGEREAKLRDMIRKESASEDIAKDMGKSKEEVMEMQAMGEEEIKKKSPEEVVEIKKVKAQTEIAEENEKVAGAKMKIQAAQDKLKEDLASGKISKEEAAAKKEQIKKAMDAVKALNDKIRQTSELVKKK
jgi:peptidoglycan hydrolase CwlO-like protein